MPAAPFDPIKEARRHWVKRWGRAPAPSMAAVTSIMRAQQILLGRLNALLREYGLTFARYEALMLLLFSREGMLPHGKMSDRLQVHPTSVTNTIDALERSGYVTRRASERDRRQTLAILTPAGREVAEAATETLNEARFATEPLSRDDLEAISAVLDDLRASADGAAGS